MDSDEDGFITPKDLKTLFENNGFNMSKTDISYLMIRFDKNYDNKISYSEFISEINPKSPYKF